MPIDKKSPLILISGKDITETETLSKFFSSHGFRILSALTSKQALGLTFSKNPNLIIIDIDMPEINGIEFKQLVKVNPHSKNIPIIFTIHSTQNNTIRDIDSIDFFNAITKPYEPNELLSIVKQRLKINSTKQLKILTNT